MAMEGIFIYTQRKLRIVVMIFAGNFIGGDGIHHRWF
jgi:hypothetical protein